MRGAPLPQTGAITARIDDIGQWLLFLERIARSVLSYGWPALLIPGGLLALAFAWWLWRRRP